MLKTLHIVALLMAVPVVAQSQDWEWLLPKPHGQIILCVGSVGRDTLFAGCTGGIFQRSFDGGTTWSHYKLPAQKISALYSTDPNHLWIGAEGKIFFSTNLGTTWTEQFRQGGMDFNRMLFADSQIGYSLLGGTLLRTLDGGINWEDTKLSTHVSAISLARDGVLFASIDSTIYKSSDLGGTWSKVSKLAFAPDGISAYTSSIVAAFFDASHVTGTTNGGVSWSNLGIYSMLDVTDVLFLDSAKLLVVLPFPPGHLNLTTDFGKTWSLPAYNFKAEIYARSCYSNPDRSIIMFGMHGGVIVKSTDSLKTFPLIHGFGTEYGFMIPFFTKQGNGLMTSGTNFLTRYSRTTDYGQSWTLEDFTNNISPVCPLFVRDTLIFAVLPKEPSVGFAVSSDVGRTWDIRGRLPTDTINKWTESNLKSGDARSGYIWYSCSGGSVFLSEDQGYNWKLMHIDIPDQRERGVAGYRISAPTKDAVYVMAFTRVYASNDKGQTWKSYKVSDSLGLSLNSMHFVTKQKGFAADKAYNMFFKTEDGGVTWKQIRTVKANAIYFFDALHGWATSASTIAKTTDGGETWKSSYFDENYHINSMFFLTPEDGWISGVVWEGSKTGSVTTLRHTVNGGVNFVSEALKPASSFSIGQNYPNPVSSNSMITIPVNFSTGVLHGIPLQIRIYDLSGKELKYFEKAQVAQGQEAYTISVAGLNPGTYFYSVQVGKEMQAGKMVVR